jgi:hypothetical protein
MSVNRPGVLFVCGDTHDEDLYFHPPRGMLVEDAAQRLADCIRRVKAADPQGFMFEDLIEMVEALGFEIVHFTSVGENW